ncbi:phage tail tape measure protein [Achromobacter marplatensis]|uniref:phage tail tape measure protein n=1 Tax=Achromobacter marplatensis TaxID=470868 RepID=UPI0028E94ABD|nr:phage tail tape measure protein [Achromobacter marplatensis]
MTDKTLGVTLTANEADLTRGFGAAEAATTQFAAKTEAALGRAGAATARMGAAAGQMTQAVNATATGGSAFTQTSERFVQALERQVLAIGKTRTELLELQAAELGVGNRAAPLIARLREQEAAMGAAGRSFDKYGNSAAQSAAAMRGVPAQLTDIVVSLQAGQQPMTVLLQQGGQLKDMFGGVVPAAKALGSTLLGLVSPYTLAAGAVAGFALAAYTGHEEAQRWNRTIQLTGNYAGVTAGSIRAMSAAAASFGGGSLGNARQAVEALVGTGQITKQTIESLSGTMVRFQRVSGQSMDDISKDFARMPEGVTKWAEEHNRSMNFMSLAQWDYIRTLEETGGREAAMQATSKALHDYLGSEAAQKVGILERAWRGLKSEVTGAWEAMKAVGRDATYDEKIADVEGRIRDREQKLTRGAMTGTNRRRTEMNLAADRAELASLRDQKGVDEATAQVKGLNGAANAGSIDAAKRLDAFDRENDKVKQLNAALAENLRLENQIRAVSPDDKRVSTEAIKAREAATRKKFEDKGASSAAQSGISAQLAAMQAQARLREEALRSETTALEGQRAAGLLSEEDFIRRRAAAQRAALSDELAIVRQQAEVAGGKKQLAERERYLGRVQELEAQIARSQQQEATDIEKYQAKIKGALRATELDITNYRETRDLQVGRQINALTLGSNERALVDAINQAQDRFRRIRDGFTDKVLREGGAVALDSEQYKQGLSQIDAAMQTQVQREREYMQQRVALQGDWKNGALLAVNEWLDGSANLMAQSQQVFSSVFAGMENAIASFVTTGKANFADFTKSVLSDMAKIAARQALMGIVGSVVSSLGAGAAKASTASMSQVAVGNTDGMSGWTSAVRNAKGNVYTSPSLSAFSNGVYDKPQVFAFAKGAGVFGEAGPEAILPLKRAPDGSLGVRAHMPNAGSGGANASSGPVQVSIYIQGGQETRSEASPGWEQFGKEIGEFVDSRFNRLLALSYKPGGAGWNARNNRS